MEKVLRLTRHEAGEEQANALRRIFGDEVEIETISLTVESAEQVAELVSTHGATVLEVVLPPNLLQAVLRLVTVPVIRAITDRIVADDGSVTFEFSRYERVLEVRIVTEPL